MAESFASSSTQAGQTARPPTVPPLDVFIRTLGCKVNQVESEDLAADLLGRGCHMTVEERAAVVVINTCTVTAEADRKARKAIRHALRLPGQPVVVVTGCLASLEPDAIEALGARVIVEADKALVADRVSAALGLRDEPSAEATRHDFVRMGERFHTRAMVKVQDGCDVFCSYCIVPHARGLPASVPLAVVVAEVERLVATGVNEVVLTGVNLGRYEDGPDRLADLVGAVAATGLINMRLSSIEPPHLTDDLLEALSDSGCACPHLHVPLQSGSDEVLRAMRRGYTFAEYRQRIYEARARLGPIAVTTDVMVGFPAETENDFALTMDACMEIGFAKLHVFRYSEREGTVAATMDGVVDTGRRAERARRLREVGERLRAEYMDRAVGHERQVLIEQASAAEDSPALGTTGDYLKVACSGCDAVAGEMVQVRLAERAGDRMFADPL